MDHSSFEETVLIATYALQDCGYNVTAASIEDSFNQIMNKTLKTEKGTLPASIYFFNTGFLKYIHESGHSEYKEVISEKLALQP